VGITAGSREVPGRKPVASDNIIIIIIIIIIIYLTASGLSPGGSGYYAYA
jgi:hypothetical protein